jgi:Outer membrane protein beta-barrel domain
MKKIFFFLLCFVSTHSFSQIKIAAEGGYNSARFVQSGETPSADYGNSPSSISTFNAGIVSEIPLSKKIFLQPALLYFGNGTHIEGQAINPGYESFSHTAIQIYYLRLPVNVVYKMKLNNQFKLLAGAGLYAAKGLSGTGKGIIEGSGLSTTAFAYAFNSKVNFSNDNSSSNETNINPFDFGFNLLAGIECKNFQLTANYSHGFSQVYSDGGYNYKNAEFGIALAYLFSLKK